MKKIILFGSIACALTACGGDGADPAPRTEPPAVSGKLTYTDESGKVVGELRGEDLAGLELGATDNRAIDGLNVRSIQPDKDFPDQFLLWVTSTYQDAAEQPNRYTPFHFIQGFNKDWVGSSFCFHKTINDCTSHLLVDSKAGRIDWEQNSVRVVKDNTGVYKDGITVPPEYFYVSGSLQSQIPPTSLIFQKNRFPVRDTQGFFVDNGSGNFYIKDISYSYEYPDLPSRPLVLPPSELRLTLRSSEDILILDTKNLKILMFPTGGYESAKDWTCIETCSYQITKNGNTYRITPQNAKWQYKYNSERIVELTGSVIFTPHNSKISMKKHAMNTDQFFISTSVSNNTARYTASFPTPPEAVTCNAGKGIAIERENQNIKSIGITCDHWDSVTKTNVQTVFGTCGLPNTPTCTGASLSADGHTFSFVKTKLSNDEELNGTLYFAGVAAAEPAVTTP